MNGIYEFKELSVEAIDVSLYLPPIVWKGDSVGHIGRNDDFFFVLKGECFLSVDDDNYIINPGQLAFLPKGKMRSYTHASDDFVMYEMMFSATANGENLMRFLGLDEGNLVVSIPDVEQMAMLFETSYRKELNKDPFYTLSWCANISNIINIYAGERRKTENAESRYFKEVMRFMSDNTDKNFQTEHFASVAHMQPTYFIRQFKKAYGIPPIAYFNRLKIYKAMGLLAGTDVPIDEVAKRVGIADTSYFARVFKKHCKITPTQYRNQCGKQ